MRKFMEQEKKLKEAEARAAAAEAAAGKKKAGASGARILNDRIEEMVTEDRTRADIIDDMAAAAGIGDSAVRQILNATIDCPPQERLEAFADVLDLSQASIMSAFESDGCNYDAQEAHAQAQNMKHLKQLQSYLGGDKAIEIYEEKNANRRGNTAALTLGDFADAIGDECTARGERIAALETELADSRAETTAAQAEADKFKALSEEIGKRPAVILPAGADGSTAAAPAKLEGEALYRDQYAKSEQLQGEFSSADAYAAYRADNPDNVEGVVE